jgi:uncharacterized membrane protein HdeD (DUF308 family)
MIINKLDLMSKGWKATEVEEASKIIEEAENKKNTKIKFFEGVLLFIMGILMLANGFVSSILLVPFIYTVKMTFFVATLAALMGIVFSILFTILIYDIEKTHKKHETNLFIAFIVNGLLNFYLILEFSARFGISSKLNTPDNVYIIAGSYLIAFLTPQIIYQVEKRKEWIKNNPN